MPKAQATSPSGHSEPGGTWSVFGGCVAHWYTGGPATTGAVACGRIFLYGIRPDDSRSQRCVDCLDYLRTRR